jgi:hypothetical protein
LNRAQLGKFGMNLSTSPIDALQPAGKARGDGPRAGARQGRAAQLFPDGGQRQRLRERQGRVNGQTFDASLTNANGSGVGDNDNLILVYCLTLPTYEAKARP